jgi:hypothetical protein
MRTFHPGVSLNRHTIVVSIKRPCGGLGRPGTRACPFSQSHRPMHASDPAVPLQPPRERVRSRGPALAWRAAAGLLCLVATAGCHRKVDSTVDPFVAAMHAYLERRGTLCLGKSAWPIDVSARDVSQGGRDALQMPVFERLGLVQGADVSIDVQTADGAMARDVRRYQLTDTGRRYYVTREAGRKPSGDAIYASDFCVLRLTLDRIVHTDVAQSDAGPRTAVVRYTYWVDAPAWARDPELQKVLPAVAGVVNGAGSAELVENFTWTPNGWVANELLDTDPRHSP